MEEILLEAELPMDKTLVAAGAALVLNQSLEVHYQSRKLSASVFLRMAELSELHAYDALRNTSSCSDGVHRPSLTTYLVAYLSGSSRGPICPVGSWSSCANCWTGTSLTLGEVAGSVGVSSMEAVMSDCGDDALGNGSGDAASAASTASTISAIQADIELEERKG